MGPKPPPKGSKGGSKLSKPSKPASKSKTPYKPKKRDEVKAKRSTSSKPTKKTRKYSEKELNIPKLNMITPAGVQKPRGKKKGKVFVDDQESMMTILAMVNADKEGQIESKMMRQRQMEEIREARQIEMEKRKAVKEGKLEETKDSLRKGRRRKSLLDANASKQAEADPMNTHEFSKKTKKRVSFG